MNEERVLLYIINKLEQLLQIAKHRFTVVRHNRIMKVVNRINNNVRVYK